MLEASDWLTILFSIIGIFGGATISWVCFRTQQLTDFNSLKNSINELKNNDKTNQNIGRKISQINEKLHDIKDTQKQINGKIDITSEIRSSTDLSSIKSTVEKLDGDLNSAGKKGSVPNATSNPQITI